MATTFVEVTPEEADKLWEAGLLWSRFLNRPWYHEQYTRYAGWEAWMPTSPSSWGTNWAFAIQVEE